ncbi:MAG: haloacid dehalogenase-like hydrolase [Myxococcales bacterium]|nr:haloacid dehalogenase-like hydrolase [Myxococcales bacterium]
MRSPLATLSAVRPTIVLFDIDGTLVSCGGAGRAAMMAALRDLAGRDDALDFPFAGGTDRAIARRALEGVGRVADDAAIDDFLARYVERLPETLAASRTYRVLEGVVALLDALEGREGLALGLGTGNLEAGARHKLRRGGLSERFGFGGFGCDHEERPRLIAAGLRRGAARLGVSVAACRCVVIGDTDRDVEAALENGAECVGVGTGPTDAASLRAAGATVAFDDLTDPAALAYLLS